MELYVTILNNNKKKSSCAKCGGQSERNNRSEIPKSYLLLFQHLYGDVEQRHAADYLREKRRR